jgi:hypothetical protein
MQRTKSEYGKVNQAIASRHLSHTSRAVPHRFRHSAAGLSSRCCWKNITTTSRIRS